MAMAMAALVRSVDAVAVRTAFMAAMAVAIDAVVAISARPVTVASGVGGGTLAAVATVVAISVVFTVAVVLLLTTIAKVVVIIAMEAVALGGVALALLRERRAFEIAPGSGGDSKKSCN